MSIKCPVCETVYGSLGHPSKLESKECGGEGNCPARHAGDRPSENAVLCACNRRWLVDCDKPENGHGFDDCLTIR